MADFFSSPIAADAEILEDSDGGVADTSDDEPVFGTEPAPDAPPDGSYETILRRSSVALNSSVVDCSIEAFDSGYDDDGGGGGDDDDDDDEGEQGGGLDAQARVSAALSAVFVPDDAYGALACEALGMRADTAVPMAPPSRPPPPRGRWPPRRS